MQLLTGNLNLAITTLEALGSFSQSGMRPESVIADLSANPLGEGFQFLAREAVRRSSDIAGIFRDHYLTQSTARSHATLAGRHADALGSDHDKAAAFFCDLSELKPDGKDALMKFYLAHPLAFRERHVILFSYFATCAFKPLVERVSALALAGDSQIYGFRARALRYLLEHSAEVRPYRVRHEAKQYVVSDFDRERYLLFTDTEDLPRLRDFMATYSQMGLPILSLPEGHSLSQQDLKNGIVTEEYSLVPR